uniref:WAS/WASL interacting protein family member 3 n=1 Tax=Cyanoderma ruficeps TaxID=181631 RepID=A0A8C3QJA4_9PASS
MPLPRRLISNLLTRVYLCILSKRASLSASSEIPKLRKEDQKARSALLADIQQGTRLKKVTQINDRSAPQIEKPKGANRDGGNPAVNKGGSQQPLGGLFAGGFPVLRPAGQRDMTGKGFICMKAYLGRKKFGMKGKMNSPLSLFGLGSGNAIPVCNVMSGFQQGGLGSSPESEQHPPDPPHRRAAALPRRTATPRLSFPPTPAFSGADVPPPLPPKSPHVLSQFHKPSNIQSLPLPPTPGPPQPAAVVETRKKRPGPGAGKLVTPPQPPARSPTTELTSKSGVSGWATAHDPYTPLKNGNMHILDDFESKFTFHSVEDFPPPDEFKPFQKTYPSKIPRGKCVNMKRSDHYQEI